MKLTPRERIANRSIRPGTTSNMPPTPKESRIYDNLVRKRVLRRERGGCYGCGPTWEAAMESMRLAQPGDIPLTVPTAKWYIRVQSDTHDPSSRRHRFNRLVPRHHDGKHCLARWIETTLPAVYHGCAVHVTTPLHHNIGVVDPDTRI